jgi:hypothetical protein
MISSAVATGAAHVRRASLPRSVIHRRTWQTLFAALLYFALACKVTWPNPIHPSTELFGPIGADLTGAMAYFHGLAAAHTPPFLPGTVHVFNAPEGRPTQWALDYSTLPSSTLLWLGSTAFGSVATFAYWPVFTFALNALSMFLLVRWLTGSWLAALVTGFAFGFWPYVFTGMNEPLGDEWPIVLVVWRMLVAIERPSLRNGLIAGFAVTFALMWVQYFILIVGLLWVVLALLALLIALSRRQFLAGLRTQAVAAVPVVLALTSIVFAGLSSNFAGAPVRASAETVAYSARPLMYLLPDPYNPWLGKLTKPIVEREYYSAHSTAVYGKIYIGISVLLLAIAGVILVGREIKRRGWQRALSERAILAAVLLTVAAFVALVFSGPPRVILFGINLPMPIELVNHVTTVFRTTARLAVLVMLGLCVLAGFALSRLFARVRGPAAIALCAVLSVIVVGDLWAKDPYPVTPIAVPQVITLLAHQKPGIYAEYPFLNGYVFGGDSLEAFYQAYAGKHDLFGGFFPNTPSESRKMELQYIVAPRTLPALAALGVRYILLPDVPPTVPPVYPAYAAPIPGAQLIGHDNFAALYRITAHPKDFTGFDSVGFALPEGPGPQFYRWMTESDGTMEIVKRTPRPAQVRVVFTAASFARARRLVVRGNGRVLYDRTIPPTTPVPVAFSLSVRSSTTRIYLEATPGPQTPHELDPANPSMEPLALQVSGPLTITALRNL